MTTNTVPAINELEQRLLDTLQAQQAAMLANSMAEAIALKELTKSAQSALRATPLGDPIGPIVTPLLRVVLGGRTTSPNKAQQPTPKPRKRVPVLDGGEPVKRKRKPTLAGVARQAVKAGIPVAGYEVRDGSIKVITSKSGEATPDNNNSNEWDGVLLK